MASTTTTRTVPDARLLHEVSYLEALAKGLRVMDTTALSLAMDHTLPIVVFNVGVAGNVVRSALGETIGTLVSNATDETQGKDSTSEA